MEKEVKNLLLDSLERIDHLKHNGLFDLGLNSSINRISNNIIKIYELLENGTSQVN